ncbi:GIY-YIG nuclease family protein [Zhihengliuella sp. ISTPL4]|uniref:GIY-YIG nuclease family protein n=1 Tax=Zhihengliuella sp. ISTPL4 TaxID=2058657 RepID=UPI000C79CF27|nr:GIY-YIG nuclease family protein [Zhihengliuella sp. ISTPL4]
MGFVYVLLNCDSSHQVKIGMTRGAPEKRAKQLRSTGVARPFVVLWAQRAEDPEELERAAHDELAAFRVDPKREFFRITPQHAIETLMRLAADAGIPVMHSATDRDITEELRRQWGQLIDPALVYVHLTHSPSGTVLTERRGVGANQTIIKRDLGIIISDDDTPVFSNALTVDEAVTLFSELGLATLMATTSLIADEVIQVVGAAQTAGADVAEIEQLITGMLASGQELAEMLAAIASAYRQAEEREHRDSLDG